MKSEPESFTVQERANNLFRSGIASLDTAHIPATALCVDSIHRISLPLQQFQN